MCARYMDMLMNLPYVHRVAFAISHCPWLLTKSQRSKSLAKDLDETLSRIEARELKVTAELAGRAVKPVHSDCPSSALRDSANPAQRNMQTAEVSAPVTSNAPRSQAASTQAKVTQPQDPVSAAVKASKPQSNRPKVRRQRVFSSTAKGRQMPELFKRRQQAHRLGPPSNT